MEKIKKTIGTRDIEFRVFSDPLNRMYKISLSHNRTMQYTGLKDANGEKIFEGDILKGSSDCSKAVVIFSNTNGWVASFDEYEFSLNQYILNDKSRKIIGNIFETPELIETSEPIEHTNTTMHERILEISSILKK